MRVHLTLKSANAKTGPIPVSTTERNSCPASCGMRAGCYATSGPLALHWSAVSQGKRGTDWGTFVATVGTFAPGTLWRHNQAGDLPQDGAGNIDAPALAALVKANEGRRGFTYTHHDVTRPGNAAAVRGANLGGFTVNLSADCAADADALAALDIAPVCVVLPVDATTNTTTPQGRRIVICPATQRDDVSCATCQLCQRRDRTVIVGFPAHGSGKRHADTAARRAIPLKASK